MHSSTNGPSSGPTRSDTLVTLDIADVHLSHLSSGESGAATRLRARIAAHLAQLEKLQIEVVSVAAEATRHMHESECGLCPDLWQHCDALEALEAREDALHHQIAALGGF